MGLIYILSMIGRCVMTIIKSNMVDRSDNTDRIFLLENKIKRKKE